MATRSTKALRLWYLAQLRMFRLASIATSLDICSVIITNYAPTRWRKLVVGMGMVIFRGNSRGGYGGRNRGRDGYGGGMRLNMVANEGMDLAEIGRLGMAAYTNKTQQNAGC
jgi:hypothetical protein